MSNVKLTIPSLLGLLATWFGVAAPFVISLPHSVSVPLIVVGSAVTAANEALVKISKPAAQ